MQVVEMVAMGRGGDGGGCARMGSGGDGGKKLEVGRAAKVPLR